MFARIKVVTLMLFAPLAPALALNPRWIAAAPATAATAPLFGGTISGTLTAWFPLTLDFVGPSANESDTPPAVRNPFLDYRLRVTFTGPSSQVYVVEGYFDGDGLGSGSGNIWRARFAADEGGNWTWSATFRAGNPGSNIAVDTNLGAGSPMAPIDGDSGNFTVASVDVNAQGFYRYGLLEYVGAHYLKFRDGPYFIKTGTDSPENLLGYVGFDNTVDQGGLGNPLPDPYNLHQYTTHVNDFGVGGLGDANDPLFVSVTTGFDSKGLIGALNYLSSEHVNSFYFLPMNLNGDGQDAYPFIDPSGSANAKTHYDISKLGQWGLVFEHAMRRGMMMHVVFAEVENASYLNLTERRLFYREMVARFGHNLAVKWNLCEESPSSTAEHQLRAGDIQGFDPYEHPIAFHTSSIQSNHLYQKYTDVLGDTRFSATSIQCEPSLSGGHVEYWRTQSANASRPWIVEIDEPGTGIGGLANDNAADLRKRTLYDVLFSGGHVEWYFGSYTYQFGGSDLTVEDFRTRQDMWDFQWFARSFMEGQLPFWQMSPDDGRVTNETISMDYGGAEVFVLPNTAFAVYFPDTSVTGNINLSGSQGKILRKRWYNPRTGMFEGNPVLLNGGGSVACGAPPGGYTTEDWVLLYKKVTPLPVP